MLTLIDFALLSRLFYIYIEPIQSFSYDVFYLTSRLAMIFTSFFAIYFALSFSKPTRYFGRALYILCILLAVFEVFLLYKYEMLISYAAIISLVATTGAEARGFLQAMGQIIIYTLIFCAGFYIIASVPLHYVTEAMLRAAKRYKRLAKALGALCLVLGLISIAFIAYRCYLGLNSRHGNPMDITSLDRLANKLTIVIKDEFKSRDYAKLGLLPEGLKVAKDAPNVVLLIGESSSRHHYGLYGYEKPTTPFLKGLYDSGCLVRFSDVISPAFSTGVALGQVLTLAHNADHTKWYEMPNIMDMVTAMGFDTYWLSNQEANRYHASTSYVSIGNIAHHKAYMLGSGEGVYNRLDGHLVSELAEMLKNEAHAQGSKSAHGLKEPDKRRFIVLHLVGQHLVYTSRYPRDRTPFSENDYKTMKLKGRGGKSGGIEVPRPPYQARLISEYDNAISYTDSVLKSAYELLGDDNTIFLYFSDHAEEVYDDGRFAGRRDAAQTVEIPLVVFATPGFWAGHRGLLEGLEAAKKRPFMSDDLIYLIASLAGISWEDEREERNVLSPHFRPARRCLTDGWCYTGH